MSVDQKFLCIHHNCSNMEFERPQNWHRLLAVIVVIQGVPEVSGCILEAHSMPY